MAGPNDSNDILRDLMTREGARWNQRADMGAAEGISFAMGRHLPDEERAHSGRDNTSGPSQSEDVDHGAYK